MLRNQTGKDNVVDIVLVSGSFVYRHDTFIDFVCKWQLVTWGPANGVLLWAVYYGTIASYQGS